jgi:hypothetical protein
MNKYQEALYSLEREHIVSDFCKNETDLLQELVDRATPMKPIEILVYDEFIGANHYIQTCPNCGLEVYDNNCCHNNDCRQALDWII